MASEEESCQIYRDFEEEGTVTGKTPARPAPGLPKRDRYMRVPLPAVFHKLRKLDVRCTVIASVAVL
jgi:hypothetical protein